MAETEVQEKPAPAEVETSASDEATKVDWRQFYDEDYIKARGIIVEKDPGTVYLRVLNQREFVVLTNHGFNTKAAIKFGELLPKAEAKVKPDENGYRKIPVPGQLVIVTAEGWPNSEPLQVKALNTKKHHTGLIEVNEVLDTDGNPMVLEKVPGLKRASLPQSMKKKEDTEK